MNHCYVSHLSHALGELSWTVEASAEAGRIASDPATLREAGFSTHHVCDAATTAYDLARRAVDPLLGHRASIGALVYATCIPQNGNLGSPERFRETGDVKHLMDFPASHLHSEFGLDGAVVIGLNQQACTGMLGSLRIARALLHAEPELGQVLCVTADRFPPGALYEQAYNLISDGAAACMVSTEPAAFRLLACHAITNGGLAHASDDETVGTYFSYTHRIIGETLARAGMTAAELEWIVAQNIHRKALQILARLLGIGVERIHCGTIGSVGHVIAGDNIINLAHLERSGALRPGDRVLLSMAGYGLNWQCVILEKC